MTGQALRYLTNNSFSPSQGARPGVTKVGVVFTDGRSQDYIGDAAKKAKDQGRTEGSSVGLLNITQCQPLCFCSTGFRMYAVGVGNAVEDELKEIASEPTGEHYFYTADFKTMTQIAKKLQINICQGQASLVITDISIISYYFTVYLYDKPGTGSFFSHRRRPL